MGDFAVESGTFIGGHSAPIKGASSGGSSKKPEPFHPTIRPFLPITDTLPEPPKPRVPLPGEGAEAFASWGGPSSLTFTPAIQPREDEEADDCGFHNPELRFEHGKKTKKEPQKPQDNKGNVTTLQEIDRQVETITVYKPNDNTIWVNVQRIKVIRFRQQGGPRINLPKQNTGQGKKKSSTSVFFPQRNENNEPNANKSEPIGDGQIIVMKMKPPRPPPRPEDQV